MMNSEKKVHFLSPKSNSQSNLRLEKMNVCVVDVSLPSHQCMLEYVPACLTLNSSNV